MEQGVPEKFIKTNYSPSAIESIADAIQGLIKVPIQKVSRYGFIFTRIGWEVQGWEYYQILIITREYYP